MRNLIAKYQKQFDQVCNVTPIDDEQQLRLETKKSCYRSFVRDIEEAIIRIEDSMITFEDAERLAMETDYAVFAVEYEGTEINKEDAACFFYDGYVYAMKQKTGQL